MARKTTIRQDDDDEGAGDREDREAMPGGATGVPREQDRMDDELRPSRLEDVVGQRAVVERLSILLEATKSVASHWAICCWMVLRASARRRWRP